MEWNTAEKAVKTNWHKNGIKSNGQARLIYVKALTATSPAREGEPVGTADTSRLDSIRWRYDADTEKERPTQPSCIVLNMTRRSRHWRLYDSEIQKGGKPLLYDLTQRGKDYHLVKCSIWPEEANSAILCEGEVDTERQTLPSGVVLNMTQRGKQCRLVWCWTRPRCKLRWKYVKWWWEGFPGVVSGNGDIREREKKKGGLLYGFRLMFCRLMAGRWAFAPIPGQIHRRETTDSFSVSTRTRRLFVCVGCCPYFFLHTFWAISVRAYMIRL